MTLSNVTRQLTDILIKERELRAKMRRPLGVKEYQRAEQDLKELDQQKMELEAQRDELEGRAISRGLMK